MSFVHEFLEDCKKIIERLDREEIDRAAHTLAKVRDGGGRLFVVGSGGGAGYASHAVCDLRKLCNVEAYSPYDNVSELTARVNDSGWNSTIVDWLKVSRLKKDDGMLVFSVGGGSKEKEISMNLVHAIEYARTVQATVVGVVGADGGFTLPNATACIVVPRVNDSLITPLTESFQAVVWHLLVSHPSLKVNSPKWESVREG